MPRRLLVTDLDGTLLRRDGTIAPIDRDAIVRAQRAGVAIAIASGRLVTGVLPTARALGVLTPLVCADGGVVACPHTGQTLEARPLAATIAEASLAVLVKHELAPFVCAPDAIHTSDPAHALSARLRSWTPRLLLHAALPHASWRASHVVMLLGLGRREGAEAARDVLSRELGDLQAVDAFPMGDDAWAVRVQPSGCTKAAALERVARRLDVAREHVAAVGDHWNDVPMLKWAARSFAMAQAMAGVKRAATDVLEATSEDGGGVAEALARLGW